MLVYTNCSDLSVLIFRFFTVILIHCKKKKRRYYGKIPGIWLPVHLPLYLRASNCRTFLEIKIW